MLEENSSLKFGETFSEGREIVTDEERSGRPATTAELKKILQKFVTFCVKIVG